MRGIITAMNRALFASLVAGAIAALPPSSAETARAASDQASVELNLPVDPPAVAKASTPIPARLQDLLIHAISLIGVKYKFGGNTAHAGFDCSGFVRHVFLESIALDLPRSSYAMGKIGLAIERDELRPGDLVFHNTLHRAFSHVGIYLGEDRFVHAPSRGKSVEIVDMSENYWKKRFNGARRLVTE